MKYAIYKLEGTEKFHIKSYDTREEAELKLAMMEMADYRGIFKIFKVHELTTQELNHIDKWVMSDKKDNNEK